jgi:hypothetical protein
MEGISQMTPQPERFLQEEILAATQVLDDLIQDHEWPQGEPRCSQNNLVEELRQRGINRALALAVIEQLLADGVFTAGAELSERTTFVGFDGRQSDEARPDRYLHTSRARWEAHIRGVRNQSPGNQEVKRAFGLHQLAARCVNTVKRLHYLKYMVNWQVDGLRAVERLREVVEELPSLPLYDDPFCRAELVTVAGLTGTSAHAAALELANRSWLAIQLSGVRPHSSSKHVDEAGNTYVRIITDRSLDSPLGRPWSEETWREVYRSMDRLEFPSADYFNNAFALEWNQAVRRIEERYGVRIERGEASLPETDESDAVPLEFSFFAPGVRGNEPTPSTADSGDRQEVPVTSEAFRDGDSTEVVSLNVWRLEGEFWTLAFQGKTVRLKDRVGLAYIAQLLSHKRREVPVALLKALVTKNRGVKPSAGVEVLDEQAMEQYRRRFEDLMEFLSKAELNGDAIAQERLRGEIAILGQQIASASGLGSRKRTIDDDSERIRKSVTNAVSKVVTLLEKKHPTLARHLDLSIDTGGSCIYAPDPDVEWTF